LDINKTDDVVHTYCWTVKNQRKHKLSVSKTWKLCWMCVKTRQNRIKSYNIRES